MTPIRLVVAEDDLLVREGVIALLSTQPDFEICGTADSYDALVDVVADAHPDLVLTDVRMPPSHSDEGIRAARWIGDEHPDVGVVVLSQYDEATYAVALLEGGTSGRGYLLKERVTDVDHLVRAVRAVAAGGTHIDPKVVERLVRVQAGEDSLLQWLTTREHDVLAEIAAGHDNHSIAEALHINIRSVEKHINSIFAKLGLTDAGGVNRRVAAVLVFLEHERDR